MLAVMRVTFDVGVCYNARGDKLDCQDLAAVALAVSRKEADRYTEGLGCF